MISLLRRPPARRARRTGRVVLRLEGMEGRATPSGDLVPTMNLKVDQDGRAIGNRPPEIVNFSVYDFGGGWCLISGQVLDEQPAGLTVSFGGSVATMSGQSTTTAADGTFSVLVQLQTDGSDTGFLLAIATDDQGLKSDEVSQYVDPS